MICLKNFRPCKRLHEGSRLHSCVHFFRLFCIITILLSGVAFLSSCSFSWLTNETNSSVDVSVIPTRDEILDRQALVRELATCISDTKESKNVFESIPSAQLDGMTYASFSAYIDALSHLYANNSDITSYHFLSESEGRAVIDGIAEDAAGYTDLLNMTIPVELFYGNEMSGDQPVYIYIQEDSNGTPYISGTWVKECTSVYDFAELYFGSMEKQNIEAVASLIESSQIPSQGAFSSSVINYKARELTQFYRLKVQSAFSDYRLLSLDISQLTYLQPEVLDDVSLSFKPRTVQFVRNELNNISVRDSVRNPLSSKDFYLYMEGEKTIRIGDRADSNQFLELFGEPTATTYGSQFGITTDSEEAEQIIVLSYSRLLITIRGTFEEDDSWDGQIIQIRIREPDKIYSLGTTIYAGMSRDTLLMLYPFADQSDYVLTAMIDDLNYKMTFVFADDIDRTITDVKIELVD